MEETRGIAVFVFAILSNVFVFLSHSLLSRGAFKSYLLLHVEPASPKA